MKAAAVLASILLAVAVAAAGCGGKKSEPTTADWAGSLCSAVSTWTTALKSTSTTLTSDPTLNGLKTAKGDVVSATDDFVSSLKGLGKPNTKAGAQAKETTDTLASQLDQDRQGLEDSFAKVSGVTGIVTAGKAIQSTLTAMGTQFTAAFTSLQQLDAKGELSDAFKQADSCKALASSTS